MNRKPSLFSRLMTGLIFLFLYAPIFVLIIFSFNNSKSRSVWAGFTLDWYDKLFHDQMILDALYTTLAVSVLAAVIATVAGTFAAIGFYNMKKRWRTPLMTVNNIPMVNAASPSACSSWPFSTFGGILPTGSTEPSGSSCPSSCTWASAPCSSPTSPSTSPM